MKRNKTQQLVLFAMFASLTTVMTLLFRIPIPSAQGYINIGDTVLLIAAFSLGPAAGFWAGAIGSALADMMAGYALYMPFTFFIKGFEGFMAGILFNKTGKISIAAFIPALWMASGYFLTDWFLYGLAVAMTAAPMNLLQGFFGAVFAIILYKVLKPILKFKVK